MGRKPWSNRRVVEDCRALNMAAVVRSGLFSPWVDSNYYRHELSRRFEWRSGFTACVTCPGRYLNSPRQSEEHLALTYSISGCEIKEDIEITSIPSPLGRGRRCYFLCPGWDDAPCGKRVGKLYLPRGEEYFRCRACHDLTYRSVKEHDKRVDALKRAPVELNEILRSHDSRSSRLALRAACDLLQRQGRLHS